MVHNEHNNQSSTGVSDDSKKRNLQLYEVIKMRVAFVITRVVLVTLLKLVEVYNERRNNCMLSMTANAITKFVACN